MPTILVCDDDKQIVEAINIYLTGEGFNVIKAYDGYEALELLEKNEVNLMIVDVMMPGLDGIRTTLKVRETSSIPIIILSAKSEDTDKIVVAPADGKIVVIEEVEENKYFHEKRLMISVFMSLFNVHANWFPVDGKVKLVHHQNGNYHKAWLPKASEENEHSDIIITTPDGVDVLCRQIAGAMARRIVTYAKEGEDCYIDEHLGFIKFGSRVDVYLPLGTEVCVKMGQKTTGDHTVIAKLK